MIVLVCGKNIEDAARVHSISWQESHRSFSEPEFVAKHTTERQRRYFEEKISAGSVIYMLLDKGVPVGVAAVTGALIEDLYILPEHRNRGLGERLLRVAMSRCTGRPTLWALENNADAARLYKKVGFVRTGKRNSINEKLVEEEYILG